MSQTNWYNLFSQNNLYPCIVPSLRNIYASPCDLISNKCQPGVWGAWGPTHCPVTGHFLIWVTSPTLRLSVPPSHGPRLRSRIWWCGVRCHNTDTSQSEASEARHWQIRGRDGFCHHLVSRVTRNNLLWHSLLVTNVTQQTPSPPSLLASRHKPIFMIIMDLRLWFVLAVLLQTLFTNEEHCSTVAAHADNIHCSTAVLPAEQ